MANGPGAGGEEEEGPGADQTNATAAIIRGQHLLHQTLQARSGLLLDDKPGGRNHQFVIPTDVSKLLRSVPAAPVLATAPRLHDRLPR